MSHDWLERALADLASLGYAVVSGVLSEGFLQETREALYRAQRLILAEIGSTRLERAGEVGVLRLPMKFAPHFFRFLELPPLLQVVDRFLSDTAILHLQNGFILPSLPSAATPQVFQNQFHMDFPRVLNGYRASLNALFAIDEFTESNGATLVVPGSHQRLDPPERAYLTAHATPVLCPAGSMVLFDSTLWHAAGSNTSGQDRLAVNHQFTRSYFKQQIDYVRALGPASVKELPARSQQLLGWYTRVVTSLEEFYQPESERLYRRGQG